MKKISLNLVVSMLVIMMTSVGMSLTIKADIGMGSMNALSGSIALISGIKVGTVLMFINVICILIQLVVQKKDFHWRQWLQLVTSIVLGEVVNIMVYQIMSGWEVNHYALRVVLLITGITISCFGVGMITRLNLIIFPVEAAANVIANVTKFNFRQVRQTMDAIAIIGALAITVICQVSLTVREGTVINFFIFSHIAHFFIELVKRKGWFESIRIK